MSQISIPDRKCDVAIVGAGPVGMMTACLVKALNKDLTIKVFDKRPTTTRDHALRIGADSIDRIHAACKEYLAHSSVDKPLVNQLIAITKNWKNGHIRTSAIEEKLTQLLKEKVQVFRGPEHEVKATAFPEFLASTKAQVVIGADGATDSQVREAIGARKQEEKPLSYLLELKYTTDPECCRRNLAEGCSQAVEAEGWDFETMSRKEPGKSVKRVTLHKFIDQKTHQALLVAESDGMKGSTAKPWTLEELSKRSKTSSKVKWVIDHIERYFDDRDHSAEKIVTFPMTMFRSSHVVKVIGNQIVLLDGDASAGIVLERGVNKGLIEAALCAKAVTTFFNKISLRGKIDTLPEEFKTYEQETLSLYKNEKWWAEWKAFGLRLSEILLKIAVKPFKWIFYGLQFLWGGILKFINLFRLRKA